MWHFHRKESMSTPESGAEEINSSQKRKWCPGNLQTAWYRLGTWGSILLQINLQWDITIKGYRDVSRLRQGESTEVRITEVLTSRVLNHCVYAFLWAIWKILQSSGWGLPRGSTKLAESAETQIRGCGKIQASPNMLFFAWFWNLCEEHAIRLLIKTLKLGKSSEDYHFSSLN